MSVGSSDTAWSSHPAPCNGHRDHGSGLCKALHRWGHPPVPSKLLPSIYRRGTVPRTEPPESTCLTGPSGHIQGHIQGRPRPACCNGRSSREGPFVPLEFVSALGLPKWTLCPYLPANVSSAASPETSRFRRIQQKRWAHGSGALEVRVSQCFHPLRGQTSTFRVF